MTTITLIRPKEQFNKYADYSIYVNGRHVLELENDTSERITVPSGGISLRTEVRWCGSETHTFQLTEEEDTNILIKGDYFFYHFGIAATLIMSLLTILYLIYDRVKLIKYADIVLCSFMIGYSILPVLFKEING